MAEMVELPKLNPDFTALLEQIAEARREVAKVCFVDIMPERPLTHYQQLLIEAEYKLVEKVRAALSDRG